MGRRLGLFSIGLIVLSSMLQPAYANRCTEDEIQKMINAGFLDSKVKELCGVTDKDGSQKLPSDEKMSFSGTWMALVTGVVKYLGAPIVALFVAAVVFVNVVPLVRLRIIPKVVDASLRRVVIRLEIENVSKVPIQQDDRPDHGCLLQMLEHSISSQPNISEFVPFTQEDHEKRPEHEKALVWREPEKVFTTTSHWYPGELTIVERLITLKNADTYLHVGLQVYGRIFWLIRALLWCRGLRRGKREPFERWTSTAIIYISPERKSDSNG